MWSLSCGCDVIILCPISHLGVTVSHKCILYSFCIGITARPVFSFGCLTPLVWLQLSSVMLLLPLAYLIISAMLFFSFQHNYLFMDHYYLVLLPLCESYSLLLLHNEFNVNHDFFFFLHGYLSILFIYIYMYNVPTVACVWLSVIFPPFA